MTYIDAHCHMADPRYDDRRNAVLARANAIGITGFLMGGVDPEDWRRQMKLLDRGCHASFGMHPWFVIENDHATCRAAARELEHRLPDAVALGELGLDHGPRATRDSRIRQLEWFEEQLYIAKRHHKPLVLHVVRAHGPALERLRAVAAEWRGLVHGFTGAPEVARAYMELGLAISVGGAVTNARAAKLRRALPGIPIDRLCVESDAPDGAPPGYARDLNEPETLWTVAETIASLTGRSPEAILASSTANLIRIFDLETQG